MKYLIIIFIIIIIIGLLANRELARDKKRIKRMIREYSFRTYSPEDAEEKHPEKDAKEKKL
jgi:septin family protein